MSCTRASPSCESRKRETASYSYRPCCALLVDLMCHSYSGRSRARAISCASCVLPVPGSPLISSGRARTMAAFTAIISSSVAMYWSVPVKRCMVAVSLTNAAGAGEITPRRARPLVGQQRERVLGGPGQERQRFAARPAEEPGAVVGRERMAALPAGQLKVALRLVARGDGKALRGPDVALLH